MQNIHQQVSGTSSSKLGVTDLILCARTWRGRSADGESLGRRKRQGHEKREQALNWMDVSSRLPANTLNPHKSPSTNTQTVPEALGTTASCLSPCSHSLLRLWVRTGYFTTLLASCICASTSSRSLLQEEMMQFEATFKWMLMQMLKCSRLISIAVSKQDIHSLVFYSSALK